MKDKRLDELDAVNVLVKVVKPKAGGLLKELRVVPLTAATNEVVEPPDKLLSA